MNVASNIDFDELTEMENREAARKRAKDAKANQKKENWNGLEIDCSYAIIDNGRIALDGSHDSEIVENAIAAWQDDKAERMGEYFDPFM